MSSKYIILLGNFGSGKSELALNFALDNCQDEKTVLVDLDIINPYFRLTDRRKLLQSSGIKLISPLFATSDIELITLPPDVYSVFTGVMDRVIFDVGGDTQGAIALGQYNEYFAMIPEECLAVYLVINPRRPLSGSSERIISLMRQIEEASRLKITGLINNSNLSVEATADDLHFAYPIIRDVALQTGLPVVYTCGQAEPLQQFLAAADTAGYLGQFIGQPLPITIRMHRDWDRFVKQGI